MLSSTSLPKLLMNGENWNHEKSPKHQASYGKNSFFGIFVVCEVGVLAIRLQKICRFVVRHTIHFSQEIRNISARSQKLTSNEIFKKNRQILLLRIFEGPKYHVFESISGRRHAFLMRVEANTIYSMSSIYTQSIRSGFLKLDFREPQMYRFAT